MIMDAAKKYQLSSILIGILICLVIGLTVFIWNLAGEVGNLNALIQQQVSMEEISTPIQNPSQKVPVTPSPFNQNQPNTNNNGQSLQADPLFGFNDPFGNSWPGFINPGDSFVEMQQRMDELMNSMTQGFPFFNQEDFGFISNGPAISMSENADEYRVVISIPDGQEVEVNTELTGNSLIVSGSVKNERDENVSGFTSRSMQESRFSQSLYLAEAVDEAGLNIERANNEIVISIPKMNGNI
jgi:HSP20 family molecular chaperone IbpA